MKVEPSSVNSQPRRVPFRITERRSPSPYSNGVKTRNRSVPSEIRRIWAHTFFLNSASMLAMSMLCVTYQKTNSSLPAVGRIHNRLVDTVQRYGNHRSDPSFRRKTPPCRQPADTFLSRDECGTRKKHLR